MSRVCTKPTNPCRRLRVVCRTPSRLKLGVEGPDLGTCLRETPKENQKSIKRKPLPSPGGGGCCRHRRFTLGKPTSLAMSLAEPQQNQSGAECPTVGAFKRRGATIDRWPLVDFKPLRGFAESSGPFLQGHLGVPPVMQACLASLPHVSLAWNA